MARAKRQFEGRAIARVTTRVKGDAGDGRVNEPLAVGESVVFVCVGYVRGVAHRETEAGLERLQTVVVSEGYIVPDVDAQELLEQARAALDNDLGTPQLPLNEAAA